MKVAALVISLAASAGVELIQKKVGYAQGPAFTLTFDAANTAGNAIVVFAFWEDSTRGAVVYDSQGNTYVPAPPVANPWQPPDRGSMAQFFYATDVKAGPNTVTVEMQPDAGTAYHTGIGILEYSGLDPDPFDGAATAIATDASNAAATPAVATTAAEGLLLGGFNDTNGSGTIGAGPGWTSQLVSVPFYILVEDQLSSDAGAYQAVATMPNGDADWVGAVLALKAARPDAGDPRPGEYAVHCGCASSTVAAPSVLLAILLAMLAQRRITAPATGPRSAPGGPRR